MKLDYSDAEIDDDLFARVCKAFNDIGFRHVPEQTLYNFGSPCWRKGGYGQISIHWSALLPGTPRIHLAFIVSYEIQIAMAMPSRGSGSSGTRARRGELSWEQSYAIAKKHIIGPGH